MTHEANFKANNQRLGPESLHIDDPRVIITANEAGAWTRFAAAALDRSSPLRDIHALDSNPAAVAYAAAAAEAAHIADAMLAEYRKRDRVGEGRG